MTPRLPVIVFDLVIPRGLGRLAAAPASNGRGFPVLTAADTGRVELAFPAAALAALIRAVFSLIVAESTVFCRLKFPDGGVA